MAKKKAKPAEEPRELSIEELVQLAKELKMPPKALEGDLYDACQDNAELVYQEMQAAGLAAQLEFMYVNGYQLGRLKELIEEYAAKGGKDAD